MTSFLSKPPYNRPALTLVATPAPVSPSVRRLRARHRHLLCRLQKIDAQIATLLRSLTK